MPLSNRRQIRALAGLSALLLASGVLAADVNVLVTDAQGRPAADAVVLIEPASGRSTVRPMPQVEVSQAQRAFQPRVTVITTGTAVNFPNFDTVRHHVYSRSRPKVFELKLYTGVPEKPLVFDKPGIVVLGCNIHDAMEAWIVVSDTPWHAVAGADGKARVVNVPAGRYLMRVWHPSVPGNAEGPTVALTVGSADLQQNVRLSTGSAP
jgi:plastocyanin